MKWSFDTNTTQRTRLIASTAIFALALCGPALSAQAASQRGGPGADVLIGLDNDNVDNDVIQPIPSPPAANQSLDNADFLVGGSSGSNSCDVLIGLLGSDVILGEGGCDITIGGPEGFVAPNKDIIIGHSGSDVNIWAPGDGDDAYTGGDGFDAQVFGVIDVDEDGVPVLSSGSGPLQQTGKPTADLTGSIGFCADGDVTVDDGAGEGNLVEVDGLVDVSDTDLGFDYLVRFFVRGDPNRLAVTIRLRQVEQIFCTNEAGDSINFADLTANQSAFVDVSLQEVQQLNSTVGQIVR